MEFEPLISGERWRKLKRDKEDYVLYRRKDQGRKEGWRRRIMKESRASVSQSPLEHDVLAGNSILCDTIVRMYDHTT